MQEHSAANKVATQIAEEKVERDRMDLTISAMTTHYIATSAAGASTGGGNRVPQGRWEHLSEQEKQERRAKVESDIRIKFNLPSNACLQCGKVHSMDASGFCPNLGTGCTYCSNKRHTVDVCFKNFNANKAVSSKYPPHKFSYGKGSAKTFLGERSKQPRTRDMDNRGVVLLDSGSNVQVMSPYREDFENLKQVEGLKVNGLGSAVIEGAGAFLGVLEGSYCPEAKTQTAILAETMLNVLDYEIQKTVVDGIRYKNISHPTQPELIMKAGMRNNGLYYLEKAEVKRFFTTDKVLGIGDKDVLEIHNGEDEP